MKSRTENYTGWITLLPSSTVILKHEVLGQGKLVQGFSMNCICNDKQFRKSNLHAQLSTVASLFYTSLQNIHFLIPL